MRFWGWILALVLVFGGWWLFHEIHDGFRLDNVLWEEPVTPEWDVAPLTQEEQTTVDAVLNQPFDYLGKGHQSFAFESADGRWVLKFIKFTYLKPSFFQLEEEKRQDRLQRIFLGYKLAYDRDRENNGLLWIHKREKGAPPHYVTLKDGWGITQTLDVAPLYFILQKKAIPTKQVLQQLSKENDIPALQQKLRQILDLYKETYSKGLYDHDHNVLSNTGFVDGKLIRIDAGRLRSDPAMAHPAVFHDDLAKIVDERLKKWIETLPEAQQKPLFEDLQKKVYEIENP